MKQENILTVSSYVTYVISINQLQLILPAISTSVTKTINHTYHISTTYPNVFHEFFIFHHFSRQKWQIYLKRDMLVFLHCSVVRKKGEGEFWLEIC